MRLSLQTVCILFGVTLAHLFVISALSPVKEEPVAVRPRIVLDPELESLLETNAALLAGNVAVEEEPDGTPAHPFVGDEAGAALAPEPDETAALTAPKLAENEGSPAPSPHEPAAREPAPAIREIRAIAPVPRS